METDTTETHHRVDLVEALTSLDDFLNLDSELVCKLLLFLDGLRDELVERRVKQTEYNRLAVHNLEGTLH